MFIFCLCPQAIFFFFLEQKATPSVDGIWKVKTQAAGMIVTSFQGKLVAGEASVF